MKAHPCLIETYCIPCIGTGGKETANGNNPQTFLIRCNGCEGRGVVWVCPHCGDVPEINQGIERCACINQALALAA